MDTERPLRVLLVEDNPDDAELTLRSFAKHHLANPVDLVRDGAEALEYVFRTGRYAYRTPESDPDLILLDIRMPFVGGVSVLGQIRSRLPDGRPLVVILTTSDDEIDINRCYQLGANGYVVKPLDFSSMGAVIGELGLYWLALNRPPTRPPARTG